MWYQHDKHILWTGGKDLRIKMWQLPEKWVSEDFNTFEETEVSNITAKLVTEKLERANKREKGKKIQMMMILMDGVIENTKFRKYN